jgi:hypothetical protein
MLFTASCALMDRTPQKMALSPVRVRCWQPVHPATQVAVVEADPHADMAHAYSMVYDSLPPLNLE